MRNTTAEDDEDEGDKKRLEGAGGRRQRMGGRILREWRMMRDGNENGMNRG